MQQSCLWSALRLAWCVQLSDEQARSELLSSTQRLRANLDPEKHQIGDQLAGGSSSDNLALSQQSMHLLAASFQAAYTNAF